MLVQNIEAGNQNQALDVVPGYYLVWYNRIRRLIHWMRAVVPGYYLVWYNEKSEKNKNEVL